MATVAAAMPREDFMPTGDTNLEGTSTPRWLRRWAVFTAAATFVLLFLGSLVTTRRAGMADPIWPTYPWHLLLVSAAELRPDFVIEHSHRLAGYLVGCCIIVLAIGLWLTEPRRGLRWLGGAALAGVILQGLLGGFRVKLNELLGTDLAIVHGCFAPVVFTLLVLLAVFTGRGMTAVPTVSSRLRRALVSATILVYLQIVFGALLRHTYSTLWPRAHITLAFAVVIAVGWATKEIWDRHADNKPLRVAATILALLVGLQVVLGLEAWLLRFLGSASVGSQLAVRTAHVLVGALVLAAAVVTTVLGAGARESAGAPERDSAGARERGSAEALAYADALARSGAPALLRSSGAVREGEGA